ncbi:MAG: DsbA family protein [Candidatus Moranbacteria bacterium]|nr:DsbA family protein [Candidatus Moranbacteria bacterium]
MSEESIKDGKKGVSQKELLEETNENEKVSNNEEKSFLKNIVSVLIIVAGLFFGSIFVDIIQLVSGQGISQKILGESDVFESGEKTWVAFDESIVRVSVLTDQECEECDPSQALLFLRRYMPTMLAKEISISSDEGKKLIEQEKVKTLPAFIFEADVKDTSFYLQASQLFEANESQSLFSLDIAQLGLPVGKYLVLPEIKENDIVVGAKDALITLVEFSDFECPYCRVLHPTIGQALEEFDGKIRFVYKHLPLSFHPQAENAALASECANEQGKFMDYADILFEKQEEWSGTEGTALFKRYAVNARLKAGEFNTCLDSQRYKEKVASDSQQAQEFGISGTPGMFVGGQFLGGAAQYETLQAMIVSELEKEASNERE